LNSDNPSSPERTLVEIAEHIGKHFIRYGNECSLDGRGMTFTWGRSVTSIGHSIRINLLQEEDGTWRISLANNERAELWTAIGIDKSLRLHSGITNIGWFETESETRPGGLLKFFPLTRAHDGGRPHPY
jgi:ribosomal protein L31E